MRFLSQKSLRTAALLSLLATAGAAQAHPGHGTSSLFEGLTHPLGADHLLAMVAVGLWSATALPAGKVWQGPATFMASLIASAVAGMLGFTVPFLENLISLSVVLFGAMLVMAQLKTTPKVGLSLIALAAAMHGLAHGAESPESGFVAYALGFLLTTALLHIGGVTVGLGIKRFAPNKASFFTGTLGLIFGGAGVYLCSQL